MSEHGQYETAARQRRRVWLSSEYRTLFGADCLIEVGFRFRERNVRGVEVPSASIAAESS